MSRPRRGSEAFPPQMDFQLCDNLIFFDKSMWRNRYTRTFEGRVEKSLGVQVPPSTPYIRLRKESFLMLVYCTGTQNPKAKPFSGSSASRAEGGAFLPAAQKVPLWAKSVGPFNARRSKTVPPSTP